LTFAGIGRELRTEGDTPVAVFKTLAVSISRASPFLWLR
jgi:hypothetical protein